MRKYALAAALAVSLWSMPVQAERWMCGFYDKSGSLANDNKLVIQRISPGVKDHGEKNKLDWRIDGVVFQDEVPEIKYYASETPRYITLSGPFFFNGQVILMSAVIKKTGKGEGQIIFNTLSHPVPAGGQRPPVSGRCGTY